MVVLHQFEIFLFRSNEVLHKKWDNRFQNIQWVFRLICKTIVTHVIQESRILMSSVF